MKVRLGGVAIVAVVGTVLASGTVALAATQLTSGGGGHGKGDTIVACVGKDRVMRNYPSSTKKCPKGETLLRWSAAIPITLPPTTIVITTGPGPTPTTPTIDPTDPPTSPITTAPVPLPS